MHIVMSCEASGLTTKAANGAGKIEFPCSKGILIDGMDIPHSILLMLLLPTTNTIVPYTVHITKL